MIRPPPRHPKYTPYDVRRQYPNPDVHPPNNITLIIRYFKGAEIRRLSGSPGPEICRINNVRPFGDMHQVLRKIIDALPASIRPPMADLHMYVENTHDQWVRVKDLDQEVIDYQLDNNDTIRIAIGEQLPDEEPDITIRVFSLNNYTWNNHILDIPNLKPTDTFHKLADMIVNRLYDDEIRMFRLNRADLVLRFKIIIPFRDHHGLIYDYTNELKEHGLGDQSSVWIWQGTDPIPRFVGQLTKLDHRSLMVNRY